jgi:uncharacterized Zn finger protein
MAEDGEVVIDLSQGLPTIDADVGESVRQKARKMLEAGGVEMIGTEATHQFQVRSPSGTTYRVVAQPDLEWMTCDCPYGKRKPGKIGCSHALAVWMTLTEKKPDPRERKKRGEANRRSVG